MTYQLHFSGKCGSVSSHPSIFFGRGQDVGIKGKFHSVMLDKLGQPANDLTHPVVEKSARYFWGDKCFTVVE